MENPFSSPDPLTPCIGICAVDHSEKFCVGCKRSLKEIANWWRYSVEEKMEVLAELKVRQLPFPENPAKGPK
jgi:predicted Fe-S protein YdhL (DUF1289 family)